MAFVVELPWVLGNYVMDERVNRKDETGGRVLVVKRLLLRSTTLVV